MTGNMLLGFGSGGSRRLVSILGSKNKENNDLTVRELKEKDVAEGGLGEFKMDIGIKRSGSSTSDASSAMVVKAGVVKAIVIGAVARAAFL